LSHLLGRVDQRFVLRLTSLVQRAGLPVIAPRLSQQDNAGRYLELMRVDKKAEAGEIKFVVVNGQGNAEMCSADDAVVRKVIDLCCA
jgi:3-dehydroquinate synthase